MAGHEYGQMMQAMADAQASAVRLRDLLTTENKRADDAIRREEVRESTTEAAEAEGDRYRLAWISARRRACDEANFGMDALALRDEEIARLKAELTHLRKSTCAAPRLECMGVEEDGDAVFRHIEDA
ncbi:hypothetical protein [Streptomyces chryseus]|uniref:hypothetical protein n=1 Tax=Streptomyces chryseus TaxID=68186 RepID=UPI00110F8036|nr:hypothetical protein [Streptomyces chryseus]GGX26761.1 hypothetical protein GCM10010353_47340 [Streptomyces chryseus]